MTTIELISDTDTITFAATPDLTGWVYDNVSLDAWYALPDVEAKLSKRPNAHGAYGLGQIFTKEAKPIVNGQYYGATVADAFIARNRLNALFSEGLPITMRVTDPLGTTTRQVWLIESSNDFQYDFSYFPFDLVFTAPDPRRYGLIASSSAAMPSSTSGLVWNLGTAASGLYFDWGAVGESGQATFANTGNAESPPRIEVGGAGAFDAGFRITEIETGRELTFAQSTNYGDVVVLDSRTQRATLDEGDVTIFLTSRDWFSIPAGKTYRYQINPLGGVTGAPTITIYAAPANL